MTTDAARLRRRVGPAEHGQPTKGHRVNPKRRLTRLVVVLAVGVVTVTVALTVRTAFEVEQIRQELQDLPLNKLTEEKTRSEAFSARVESRLTRLLWNNVFSGFGAVFTAVAALTGTWVGFRRYLDTREKERLDRAASDLSESLKLVASDKSRERAVGVVGLQHFLMPDKKEYHLRALSAVLAAARSESDPEVMRGIRIAVEQAAQALPADVLRRVSWQGVRLSGVVLRGVDLLCRSSPSVARLRSLISGSKHHWPVPHRTAVGLEKIHPGRPTQHRGRGRRTRAHGPPTHLQAFIRRTTSSVLTAAAHRHTRGTVPMGKPGQPNPTQACFG